MKDKIKKLLVYVVALAVLIPLGFVTKIFSLQDLKEVTFDLSKVWKLLVVIFVVLVIANLITMFLESIKPKNHRARSVLSISASLLKYLAFIIILCWGLTILGVNVSTIVASIGIVALIVGFSAESLIADVVNGAFMLFENQYNVGDIVEVNGFRGTVSKIGIRTTCITDVGGNVKIVNNSDMRNILNRSDNLSYAVSDIAVPYGTDFEKLEKDIPGLMEELFEKNKEMFKAVPDYKGIQQLGDSGVVLRFVVNVNEKDIYTGMRVLNHDLLLGFRKLGVECPFPQVDVHSK
ncbi:MAG: mechanosensitive ion channel [Firmicutes bacterium]|nr:mechanosensitive ion channel [Bacillota bacterium]MBR0482335.1 mechanosensitive ion channel [Bacillota bacterium]